MASGPATPSTEKRSTSISARADWIDDPATRQVQSDYIAAPSELYRLATMQILTPYHHYSTASNAPRTSVEQLEQQVVALLLSSTVDDAHRESSVCFELKHSSAVTQFSRLLARQRSLPVDVCAAGGLLHDIYVVVEGGYADHAHLGTPIARSMMEAVGGFQDSEIKDAESIVWNHSDKHLTSDDPFAEFGKDVDVLDAFLYPGAFDWYLANKPLATFFFYLSRAKRVWADLGVPAEPGFEMLDDFNDDWLNASTTIDSTEGSLTPTRTTPPLLLTLENDGWRARYAADSWTRSTESSPGRARRYVASVSNKILADTQPKIDTRAMMVWPAINRIEIIDGSTHAMQRLHDLLPDGPIDQQLVGTDK
jgi:HD domain